MKLLRILLTAMAATSIGWANLITNGSFESGTFASCSNGSYCNVPAGGTSIDGWTVGGVGVDWHNNIDMQGPYDGALLVDLNLNGTAGQTGTLSQSFATTAGQSLLLTFYLAGTGADRGFPSPRQVVVDIAGINQTFQTPASPTNALQWQRIELAFVAQGSSTTLVFSSPNDAGFWGPLLDSVSVDVPPGGDVPEPAAGWMLGLGLLVGAVLRNTRKT